MILQLNQLSKAYHGRPVLKGLCLTLNSQAPNCLMSPSGWGKTTLLRIIAGLETADQGSLTLTDDQGRPWGRAPKISMVFQEDRLCPGFSPVENVYMVCSREKSREQVREELSLLLPVQSLDRPAWTLSGGMKRRTALCRALCAPFDILLMDEPFTGLDQDTRRTAVRYTLDRLQGRLAIAATHDPQEARLLGGRVISLAQTQPPDFSGLIDN